MYQFLLPQHHFCTYNSQLFYILSTFFSHPTWANTQRMGKQQECMMMRSGKQHLCIFPSPDRELWVGKGHSYDESQTSTPE
jgi:hypothetical protein